MSTPRSACFRRNVSRPHSACQSCPCATAPRDGSPALPHCWWAQPLRLARTSTAPRAASGCLDTSLRLSAHHTGCLFPTAAPPLGGAGSCRSERSTVLRRLHVCDATTQTSGALGPASPYKAPRGSTTALHRGKISQQMCPTKNTVTQLVTATQSHP